jgi:hypothetical protein
VLTGSWRNTLADAVIRKAGIPIVPSFNETLWMADMHRDNGQGHECTHFCHPSAPQVLLGCARLAAVRPVGAAGGRGGAAPLASHVMPWGGSMWLAACSSPSASQANWALLRVTCCRHGLSRCTEPCEIPPPSHTPWHGAENFPLSLHAPAAVVADPCTLPLHHSFSSRFLSTVLLFSTSTHVAVAKCDICQCEQLLPPGRQAVVQFDRRRPLRHNTIWWVTRAAVHIPASCFFRL